MSWVSTCIWNSEMNWWQNRINRKPNLSLRHIGKLSQDVFIAEKSSRSVQLYFLPKLGKKIHPALGRFPKARNFRDV